MKYHNGIVLRVLLGMFFSSPLWAISPECINAPANIKIPPVIATFDPFVYPNQAQVHSYYTPRCEKQRQLEQKRIEREEKRRHRNRDEVNFDPFAYAIQAQVSEEVQPYRRPEEDSRALSTQVSEGYEICAREKDKCFVNSYDPVRCTREYIACVNFVSQGRFSGEAVQEIPMSPEFSIQPQSEPVPYVEE